MTYRTPQLATLFILLPASWLVAGAGDAPLSFNRDIRPILSDNCFRCHGPDSKSRQAQLRLDDRNEAIADRGGYSVIVPGDDQSSELLRRVAAADHGERMPPPESNKQLAPRDIELLRAWIRQGAKYEKHWAFEPLGDGSPPRIPGSESWNGIDAFVAAKLREHGLQLAPQAPPETLLRRVTLDLIGLPPTLAEFEEFRQALARPAADPDACYERVVDRLLQSPHFGEHLAVQWLDAARYADTNGYFGDKPRQMWLWRDWVIDAFNSNMPFDQFTIEQLAGDLLPDPSISQRIATAFNRNHMANNETGIIDEEFRVEYVADRVHTTMTAWLGLTAGCAQCHDHKFDPISQREFYGLFAFFNNVPETGLIVADNPPPLMSVPTADQQRRAAELEAERGEANAAFAPVKQQLEAAIAEWEKSAQDSLALPPAEPLIYHNPFDGSLNSDSQAIGNTIHYESGVRDQAAKFDATQHVEASIERFNPDEPWTIGVWFKPDGTLSCLLSIIEPAGDRRGIEILFARGVARLNLVHEWSVSQIAVATVDPISAREWHHLAVSYDGSRSAGGVRLFVDGVPARVEVHRDTLGGTMQSGEPLRIARRDDGLGFYGSLDELRILSEVLDSDAVSGWFWGERIRGILAKAAGDRPASDAETLLDYYIDRFAEPAARQARQRVKAVKQAEKELKASIASVLVMQEKEESRPTHVLERGEYDKPGDRVEPGVLEVVAPWPQGEPVNRLGLARWLVSPENPLTPRVAVNRLWQHCFGEGLVRTVDDFGSQGEPPTHPELLDWLAATFRDSGWDVKSLLRLIVTSRTYKQDSGFAAGVDESDPENRLLGRGPRVRLSAEMLRDQALAVSGLLVPHVGGPSVKPYQPPGLWEEVSYNGEETYEADGGEGLWRRSVYTYIKRQAPPPTLLIFDGPTREKCSMRRAATNTPLQSLVLLNDETYVEASRVLAARLLSSPGDDRSRLLRLFRLVLSRDADSDELRLLAGLLDRQRRRFDLAPGAAAELIATGAASIPGQLDPRELAAWTVVSQAVLNLDEAITKR